MLDRRLYSNVPPPARTSREDHPTLLVTYWCSFFALGIILFRLAGRYVRTEQLFREDKIMAFSIVPLLSRLALIHVVLIYGTNNAITIGLGPVQIHKREIGSRLKFTITGFLARLTHQHWKKSFGIGLQITKWTLLASFILVVIGTIAECQPFPHYWQVVPDPGPRCRQGYVQLLVMGVCNVITDLLLVFFPIPIILRSQMSVKRKCQLSLLFALSLFPAGITLYRIPAIIERKGIQQYRTLWASIEILAAAAVANALVLGSFVRDRGPKKAKYKPSFAGTESEEWPSIRRGTAATAFWGSDEDLVRDMGLGLDPEMRAMERTVPVRPAPIAGPHPSKRVDLHSANWQFPTSNDGDSSIDLKGSPSRSPMEGSVSSPKVSFFDVGGLLDDPDRRSGSSSTAAGAANNGHSNAFSSPTSAPNRGSAAILQDIGGLLSSDNRKLSNVRNFSRNRTQPEAPPPPAEIAPTPDRPPQSRTPNLTLVRSGTTQSLQDVGGLLRD
ncbi:hypothetical protein FGG08_004051 [Glutinoglossum americanum]|uniref:Rhodopsin domain-containing protein n=1 Tax=Glutinoglossum americanum TaxID=1670608 RepID=A0A9P8IC24_9PEZI|nr:hypothetical protein FGG08_004051 [Glutinoglossum americanum]